MLYQFETFEIESETFEFRRDGQVQHLEPLVFDLLLFLVKNPNRIVTREEIINEIWGGRIISDATISSCIKSARRALGDNGEEQKFIKTVRGRGFKFIANVDGSEEQKIRPTRETTKDGTTRAKKVLYFKLSVIGALFLFVAILFLNQSPKTPDPLSSEMTEPYSIAIMPFVDMSASGDQEYFGYGMAEEIINILAAMKELDVTSRTSAFSLQGQNLSIPDIADKLGVNYIIEGSINSADDKIRVSATLIEVSSDSNLWTGTYDRKLEDIFAVQDEISTAITSALRIELIGPQITHQAPTNNMEAYTLYLKGHELFLNRSRENIEQAIILLNAAIELDENFAEAWADLASCYTVLNSYGNVMDETRANQLALDGALKAIELKPELAQAWAIKGYINIKEFKRREAQVSLEKATTLDPRNETAWMWLGSTYTSTGFIKEATEAYKMAVEIAPASALNHGNLGRNYMMLGDIENARRSIDASLDMGWWPASIEKAAIALMEGDRDLVISEYSKVLTNFGQTPNENLGHYVDAYFDKSLVNDTKILLDEDMKTGNVQAILGTLLLLDGVEFITFVENNNIDVIITLAHVFRPPFRSLLNQPPVKEYLMKIGLVDYWRSYKWPDFCHAIGDNDFECDDGT